jgi:AAA+ superfamily predicted ATPase
MDQMLKMQQMQQLAQQQGLAQLQAPSVNRYGQMVSIASPMPATKPPKRKFKVGDVVIGGPEADVQYGSTTTGTKWKVLELLPEGVLRVTDPENGGAEFKIHEQHFDLVHHAKGDGKVSFDTVILAEHKKEQIVEAISQVDHHNLIFEEWGFSEVFEKGTAISLLFYGLPGTGKTLMAQAIADKYKRKLQVISTAEIETPEPGGAERNLKKYFAEAQKENSVLLFDECDSLITDRGRVGMILAAQINALLTELERFTGIVIFTTNRLGALDAAFDRRLSLKLEFDMPDAKHRVLIWKRMFPERCPLAKDIRWDDLAKIEIAGGHIKNVVLKAARKAAATGLKEITDEVLWDSLEKEVISLQDYKKALDAHNPYYGTPVQGGAGGGMSVARGVADKIRGVGKTGIKRG